VEFLTENFENSVLSLEGKRLRLEEVAPTQPHHSPRGLSHSATYNIWVRCQQQGLDAVDTLIKIGRSVRLMAEMVRCRAARQCGGRGPASAARDNGRDALAGITP